MAEQLKVFLREIFETRAPKHAMISLLISICITTVCFFILAYAGGVISEIYAIDLTNLGKTSRYALITLFLVSFVGIWFFLHIQFVKEADDVFSEIRKMLVGTWSVFYRTPEEVLSLNNNEPAHIICSINLNKKHKLEMGFKITDFNPIFENGIQNISIISITDEAAEDYLLTYYYSGERNLKYDFYKKIKPVKGEIMKTVDIEVFGWLRFKARSIDKHVKEMSGEWFDLNGNIIRIYSIKDEIAAGRVTDTSPIEFLEAPISQSNFISKMGTARFSRIMQ